jgi:hypothetical protein
MLPITHTLHILFERNIHIFPASLVGTLCRYLDVAPSSASLEDELRQLLCERLKEACSHVKDRWDLYKSPCYQDASRMPVESPEASVEPIRMIRVVQSDPIINNTAEACAALQLPNMPTSNDIPQGGNHINNGSDSLANTSSLHTEGFRRTDRGDDSESPHFETRRQGSQDPSKLADISEMRP